MSTKIEKTDKADAKADALVSISSADLQLLKDAALERDQLRVELQASATSLESLRSERAKLQESLSKGGNETLDDHSLLQREIETLKDQVQRATDDAMRYAEEAKRADAKLRELTQAMNEVSREHTALLAMLEVRDDEAEEVLAAGTIRVVTIDAYTADDGRIYDKDSVIAVSSSAFHQESLRKYPRLKEYAVWRREKAQASPRVAALENSRSVLDQVQRQAEMMTAMRRQEQHSRAEATVAAIQRNL